MKSTDKLPAKKATEPVPVTKVVGPPKTRGRLGGRKKGTPNKIRVDVTNIIRDITDNNIKNAEAWLIETSINNPAKALELYIELLKLITPKPIAAIVDPPSTKGKSFWEETYERTKRAAGSPPIMSAVS